MIFSGSTAGGSGGLRSDLLPERSRRAAAALSWAAIFMGLEMFDVRRRAGAARLRSRREFSEQRCLASLLWCAAARRINEQRCRHRSINQRSRRRVARRARAAASGHAFFYLGLLAC